MKILIDLFPCQTASRHRGVGRYTLGFTKAFIKQAVSDEIILLVNGLLFDSCEELRKEFLELLYPHQFKVYAHPSRFSFNTEEEYKTSFQLVMSRLYDEIKPDVIINTNPFEGDHGDHDTYLPFYHNYAYTYCILYDFIPYIFKDIYLANENYKKFYLQRLNELKSFDHYLSISESTSTDGVSILNKEAHHFTNISAAVASYFGKQHTKAKLPNGLHKGFILYGGNLDYRKNLQGMFKAFSLLPKNIKNKYPLVLTYIHTDNEIIETLRKDANITSSELIYLGHVSDEMLNLLYSKCSLFCMPSLYEGFGLPALEAMTCGAATLVGNNSSLKEIVKDKRMLFDASNAKELSSKIAKTLTSRTLRKEIQEYGLKRSKDFSWAKTAAQAWKTIRQKGAKKEQSSTVINNANDLAEYMKTLPSINDATAKSLIWNNLTSQKPRIIVDTSQMCKSDAKSGIQRVVKNVIQHLLALSNHEVITIYLHDFKLRVSSVDSELHFSRTEISFEFHPGDIFFMLDSSWDHIDEYLPHYRQLQQMGGKVLTMVYDLIPVRYPQYCHHGLIPVFTNWLEKSIRYSDGIIAISQFTADDTKKFMEERLEKDKKVIYYSHLGSDPKIEQYVPNDNSTLFNTNIPTFLCVGTIEPRKGHKLVLRAFENLWKQNIKCRLIFVGRLGWNMDVFADQLKKINTPDKFIWLNNADDITLEECYSKSDALIIASEVEGFGLPIIEAAHYNLPVIASDIPVFREIGLDHVFYFKRNPNSLTKEIKFFLSLDKKKIDSKIKGINLLSWKDCSNNIYEQLIGAKEPYLIN